MRRTAIVITPDSELETIERYLPDNYTAREVTVVVIEGTDNAGWTMDDYVLPRLATGLHIAAEVGFYMPKVTV
jgi:hypothetical protein